MAGTHSGLSSPTLRSCVTSLVSFRGVGGSTAARRTRLYWRGEAPALSSFLSRTLLQRIHTAIHRRLHHLSRSEPREQWSVASHDPFMCAVNLHPPGALEAEPALGGGAEPADAMDASVRGVELKASRARVSRSVRSCRSQKRRCCLPCQTSRATRNLRTSDRWNSGHSMNPRLPERSSIPGPHDRVTLTLSATLLRRGCGCQQMLFPCQTRRTRGRRLQGWRHRDQLD